MELRDSTFLISGGASGLGAATARRFAGAGARVLIADVNADRGSRLAADLGACARFVRTDVTDEDSVQAAVDAALQSFGGLQGAVCCAGIGVAERTVGRNGPHPLASFVRVITVNLIGTFNVIRLAAAAIAQGQPRASGERGVMVNTASVAAFDGQIGQAAYCRFPSRPASAAPKSTPPWRSTSSKTKCSTAKSFAWTEPSGWPRASNVRIRNLCGRPSVNSPTYTYVDCSLGGWYS